MFNKQTLKTLLNERLSETAEEIFLLFEQAVAEYQRETNSLKHVGEAEKLEAVPSPQWTKVVQQEEVAEIIVHTGNDGYFPCEVKTEPSMTQEDEPPMLITNVKSLFNGDELQLRGREHTTNSEGPEASGAAGTENNPETSPEPEEEDSDTANDEDASRSDALKETFSCPACKKCFPRIRGLKTHMKIVHPREKQLYNAVCKVQLDREHIPQTQPDVDILIKPLSCTVCLQRYKLQSSLDAHMRAHTEEKSRTCAECGASFPNHSSFISHMREVHSTDKPFRCTVCYRDCKEITYLKRHMRSHTGERPYLCSVCGKGFTISSNLKSHMRTHNRIKPFRCEKCGNKYKSKTALKQHKCAEVFLSPKLSLEGAQQTEVESHEAQAELNKDNTGSSQCNAETEQMNITQEEEPQTPDVNVDSLNPKDELQPRGQQKANSALPEEQASGAAETDNCPETSPEPEDDSDTANDEDASRSDPAKKTFSCPACKRRFPRIWGLKIHMKKVHPRKKQLYAALCKDQLDREQFTQTQPDVDILIKPLSCTVCSRRFKLQSSLDVHMRAHSEENPRTCAKCGASFPNKSSFISHMRQVHSSDKLFRCSVCYRDCKELAYLKIHMRIHTGERPYLCSVCGKGFIVSGNLKSHMRTHNRIKPFRCEKCGNKSKSKTALKQHKCAAVFLSPKLSLEGALQTEVASHEAQAELNKDNTGSSQYEAETEEMLMQEEKPQTLNTNVERLKSGNDLRPRGQQKANSALPEEQASGAAETDNCSETSPEPEEDDSDTANDEDASKSDPAKKTFSCPACKRRFPLIKGLKMHMRMVHPREKQLYAALCKDQLDREQFTQTQPDVDILIKPLSCTVCFRRFKLQSFLDAHMRAHAEENPRTCAECGASFPNQSSFSSHMREVHSTDKPFRCSVCYRDCKNLTYLKIHMRIHTGERPFVCTVCGKGFIVSGNLATHMRTHNRIKPFRCGKCGNKYKSKTALKNHKCEAVVLNPKLSLEGAQQTEVESHKAQAGLDKDNTGSSQYEAETEEMVIQEEKPQTLNTNVERLNRGNDLRPRGRQQKTNNSSESSPESEEEDSDPSFDAPKKSFSCPACKRCFPQIRGLKMHMRRVHPGEKQLYAAVCNAKPDSLQRSPSEPDMESEPE